MRPLQSLCTSNKGSCCVGAVPGGTRAGTFGTGRGGEPGQCAPGRGQYQIVNTRKEAWRRRGRFDYSD